MTFGYNNTRDALAKSLPTRGAWIEIGIIADIDTAKEGRSPHGERGLKFGDANVEEYDADVAPHTGSVD